MARRKRNLTRRSWNTRVSIWRTRQLWAVDKVDMLIVNDCYWMVGGDCAPIDLSQVETADVNKEE
jgi:hypothetical protein